MKQSRLLLVLLIQFLINPYLIILVSQFFTPINYIQALLTAFVIRVVKYNINTIK